MATEQARDEAGSRSFSHFVANVGEGDIHQDLSKALHELSSELQDMSLEMNAKTKGKMTVVFSLSCDQRGNVGVDCEFTLKKPKRKRATAQAWVNKQGNLVFEPPRQLKMDLRDVGGRRELRDIDGKTELQGG